jgi:hypothetical protein
MRIKEQDLNESGVDPMVVLRAAVDAIVDRNLRMRALLHRLLDCEDLGYACTQEVRDLIRNELQQGRK